MIGRYHRTTIGCSRRQRRPRDLAALLLGVICLTVAVVVALKIIVGLTAALIPFLAPIVLIAVAVLALISLRR